MVCVWPRTVRAKAQQRNKQRGGHGRENDAALTSRLMRRQTLTTGGDGDGRRRRGGVVTGATERHRSRCDCGWLANDELTTKGTAMRGTVTANTVCCNTPIALPLQPPPPQQRTGWLVQACHSSAFILEQKTMQTPSIMERA